MAHVWWRVRPTAFGVAFGSSCNELELRSSTGGGDLTDSVGGTALAGAFVVGYEADKAFDNNTSTRWAAGSGLSWIGFQFASAVDVAEFQWTTYGSPQEAPTAGVVEYSDDGTTWTSAWSFALENDAVWQGNEVKVFRTPATTGSGHEWWRIYSASGAVHAAAEIEMRETAGGADVTGDATVGNAIGHDYFNANVTYHFSKAFNNNGTTDFWAGDSNNGWIGFHFGTKVDIHELAWTTRNDSSYAQAPSAADVQYSDDGQTWTTFWSWSGLTWSMGETKILPGPPVDDGGFVCILW